MGLSGAATLSAGCGAEQRHHDREALVRRADHADAAVRFGRVLHEPVDGVIGVGHVIALVGLSGPRNRARHYVVALGFVLAAHVLKHADVAVGDKHLVALRQDREHV